MRGASGGRWGRLAVRIRAWASEHQSHPSPLLKVMHLNNSLARHRTNVAMRRPCNLTSICARR
eukprot:6207680-Pleurochrysis_carterae.AAC.2